jgi:hypothetical protein
MSLADKLEGKEPSQPQRPSGGKGGKSKTSALARQNLKEVAVDLMATRDNDLTSLGAAMVDHRRKQVSRFADFLEQVQDGTVDAALLGEELAQRAASREKAEVVFTVDASSFEMRDFQVRPDMIRTLTGQAFTRALEGI